MRRNAKAIPDRIKRLMLSRQIYSLRQLADVSGVHKASLYRWINTGRINKESAVIIAKTLECDVEELGNITTTEKRNVKGQTLCWTCKNAVPDMIGHGCEWSRSGKPVEGWTAEEDMILDKIESYKVIECPKYEEGE